MGRSSYVWQQRFEGNAASARDWLWRAAPIDRWVEPNAAYTLLTTAPDYARFVAAVLTGRGLSPATWQAFLTPVRETGPGTPWRWACGSRTARTAASSTTAATTAGVSPAT